MQISAASHAPAAARHTVLLALYVLAGQVLFTPSQLSAMSQPPTEGRQTAVLLASAGQVSLVPVQLSAISHSPAAARQTVVAA